MDTILTPKEVAEYLKVSKSKIYYLLAKNQIPHLRIGKNRRVRMSDLEKWIEKHATSQRPMF